MSNINREYNTNEFEYLKSEFPHVSPNVIQDYLELYNFEDTLYTIQTFYPANNESISQEDKDEMISILNGIHDLDIDVCSILLEESNYDLELAKENANKMCKLLDQHKKAQIEEQLLILREEFPNEDESIIRNALEFAGGDYSQAKSYIIDQIPLSPQSNVYTKTKNKKYAVFENGQVTYYSQQNKKRQKKEKKKSQFIQFDRKRDEGKEYQNQNKKINDNENNNSYENENESTNKENNNNEKFDDEIESTKELSKQKLDNDNDDDDEIKSTKEPMHNKITNNDNDDDDEYWTEKRRLKKQNHSTNKSTKMPQRYFKPPELVVRDIDLHGVREVDAEEIVLRSLNDAQNSNVLTIRFITGAGHHSENNRSILRPLVFKICRRMGYKPCLSADKGCVICKIK